ncbi:hypothetical protein [Aeromicrobium ginsengisoli]|uniref:Uncharacterized protein n=1 Tax=Aeromicrobium ginsengisoli TaxID=363867 RepID=A0A5M4F9T1_9ACTN|nr:hypothetical protein [Aeromicrobium ginsengisoli]KAA1395118.1 hypothetical protein ESP70_013150 [Aeromicrobium ginsengisoli]
MYPSEAAAPGTGQTSSDVRWPAGPHYFDLTDSDGGVAWIRYRVWSADWHTRALIELGGTEGSFDRMVGIEMALDGALNSLSSAFDAGITLLIRAVEEARDVSVDNRLPVFRYRWERCRDMLKQSDIANDSVWRLILEIDAAIEGETHLEPAGWLAQLRRLRNRAAHQDSLSRHHEAGKVTGLVIQGQRTDASTYLAGMCDRLHDLTEHMIRIAISIGAHETSSVWNRDRWNPAGN